MSYNSEREKQFYEALKQDINILGIPSELFDDPNADRPYFKSQYYIKKIEELRPDFKLRKDIRAVASSARLAFLDFHYRANTTLEKTLTNDIGANTEMDAVTGNIYYECKFQEIVRTSHDTLSNRYGRSHFFEELMGKKIGNDSDNEQPIIFGVKDLGIELENRDYNKLHFDLKQMICHLLAIARKNQVNKEYHKSVLQYVIYKPSEESISKRPKLKELYLTLEDEIDKIWNGDNRITRFCEDNSIILAAPAYKSINLIDDFVLDMIRKDKNRMK